MTNVLKEFKSSLTKVALSKWAEKLVAIKTMRPRIAILTEGAEEGESINAWKRTIQQYGQVALKDPRDTTIGISVLIVPSANLTADSFLGSDKRDLELSRWWLSRSCEEKNIPSIYCGKSGLIFVDIRSTSTCLKVKEKGFIPLFNPDNTKRGSDSKADYFVAGGNFFGIRRFCVPEGAKILYTTPISVISGSGVYIEEFVLGFSIKNTIVLLFNPEELTQKENGEFFMETSIRFGSEIFLESLYSLISKQSDNDNNEV